MVNLRNLPRARPHQAGVPVAATSAVTFEGGAGYAKGVELELFTLGVTFLFGEPTFYEAGGDRAARYEKLIGDADPGFVAGFLPWLRADAGIRTASLVGAVLYARAHPGTDARRVVDSVCRRADEPAEILAYARHRYGAKIPQAVLRGAADAARRLYNETTYLKWDSPRAAMRMGDVLQLAHPRPVDDHQAALFDAIVNDRVVGDRPLPDSLRITHSFRDARRLDVDNRRTLIRSGILPDGFTWEDALSWAPADVKRQAWELVIPRMGVMALLRNLRNFAEAEIGPEAVEQVCAKITSPDDVRASRIYPHQALQAWVETQSMTYGSALERCVDLATGNVPAFAGRTLVLVDTSGSMGATVSGRSKLLRRDVAGLFGAAVAKRNPGGAALWAFGTDAAPVKVPAGASALRITHAIKATDVGYSTNTWSSLAKAWATEGPFDRVVIFTDMQAHPSVVDHSVVPCPIYSWDLAGYPAADIPPGSGRYLFGGFSDAAFRVVPLLERGADAGWPWAQ